MASSDEIRRFTFRHVRVQSLGLKYFLVAAPGNLRRHPGGAYRPEDSPQRRTPLLLSSHRTGTFLSRPDGVEGVLLGDSWLTSAVNGRQRSSGVVVRVKATEDAITFFIINFKRAPLDVVAWESCHRTGPERWLASRMKSRPSLAASREKRSPAETIPHVCGFPDELRITRNCRRVDGISVISL
ncbi:hypothetical protein B296_00035961 [Ensete ventricosum]|uniref:Uncharacterized protein n=1 Tax=Ensete ventricosum TaxID=4639 RepID=A0A426ZMZ9_ENSVE|nr:hypothetical protein B296_00035961 [Ensete ventricosum]